MKFRLTLCGSFLLLTSVIAQAGPVLVVGAPSDSYNSPAVTKPSPNLGGTLINFESLTPFATFSTYSSQGVSLFSPDGLVVYPFSTQSGPNELFDASANGSADISVNLAVGSAYIGVGIADSDIAASGNPVTITLQPLGAGGVSLGSSFAVTIPETGSNPGNAYYVVKDTTSDIFGLQITQPVGDANFSGLAIDDVQLAPEPSSFALLIGGVAILGWRGRRKLA